MFGQGMRPLADYPAESYRGDSVGVVTNLPGGWLYRLGWLAATGFTLMILLTSVAGFSVAGPHCTQPSSSGPGPARSVRVVCSGPQLPFHEADLD